MLIGIKKMPHMGDTNSLNHRHAICHKLYTDKISKWFVTQKRVNYNQLPFPTKQCKLYFYMINIHTQGYITLRFILPCKSLCQSIVPKWIQIFQIRFLFLIQSFQKHIALVYFYRRIEAICFWKPKMKI